MHMDSIEVLVLTIYLTTLHTRRWHLRKRKYWTIIDQFLWNVNQRWTGSTVIPKLLKCPFKHHYIARSAKCSMKPLSKVLTCTLSAAKTGLQSYRDTSYSRGGVNQRWIMKTSKCMLHTNNPMLFGVNIFY